jgi:hypothetical protein
MKVTWDINCKNSRSVKQIRHTMNEPNGTALWELSAHRMVGSEVFCAA